MMAFALSNVWIIIENISGEGKHLITFKNELMNTNGTWKKET